MLRLLLFALLIYVLWRAAEKLMRSAPRPRPLRRDPPSHRSPFAVLGVAPGASQEEIRAAYQQRIFENHPDRVASMSAEIRALAEQRTREINLAYEELKGG